MAGASGDKASLADVLALYRRAPLGVRAFLRGRVLLSDLEFVERHVPERGSVLDLGCGHGLFSNLMALRSESRQVIGIDLSPEKIKSAQATVAGRPNIMFVCGDILRDPLPQCDAITIVDVMYLLPAVEQHRILRACHQMLKPGGVLVWKAQERKPLWKYAFTYLQELLSTSIGFTQGKRGKLCFLSRQEAVDMMVETGFKARVIEMKTRLPYSDIIYMATR